MSNRIQKAFNNADELLFGDLSRFAIISDCHRGYGDNPDNFAKNKNIYYAALSHYYKNGFTYIELGDGDELWANRDFGKIVETNSEVFGLLAKFHEMGRLYLVYGNHDIIKKNKRWVKENMFSFHDGKIDSPHPLFPDIKVHEAIILKHKRHGGKIFLLHGHQADFFNDRLSPVAMILVRYLWRPLESIGVTDPTSAAKSDAKKNSVELKLARWAEENGVAVIAGHTHRYVCPEKSGSFYLNDGCCVYPGGITAIEIQDGMLCLVKWHIHTRDDNALYVTREVLCGSAPLQKYLLA